MSNNDIESALKSVLKKSASDAAFRAKAINDPAAALKEAGVELPAGQKIKFVEKLDEIVIALPPLAEADSTLSDETLEQAAGGTGYNPAPTFSGNCSTKYTCRCSVSFIL